MFRKIPKDPKILEMNIGTEVDDGIIVSDYDLRLLYDYGIYPERIQVDENLYSIYKGLYERAYNPEIFLYNDYLYIKISKQRYLRHRPKPEYIIAFDLDLERHLKASVASKLKLLIHLNGRYFLVIPYQLNEGI
ncbi:MAG: hypothetical protein NZ908_02130 [Candidatus Micrarchaeota archaeon]|nr:hypothetical protein [Candidatus Micrarchaeota archaeon]MCX8154612.1 hypothetical protein [Candidatus Micrarchaeota archaeon]